jgi:hypothetical protein
MYMYGSFIVKRTSRCVYELTINRYSSVTHSHIFYSGMAICCGPGSSVGIATGYGMGGQGIESRWGRDFPHLSRPALGSTQPSVQWVPGLSRGLNVAGA